jgi:hypothetical protein
MQIAIGIGTLLLGGWVLTSPQLPDEQYAPARPSPSAAQAYQPQPGMGTGRPMGAGPRDMYREDRMGQTRQRDGGAGQSQNTGQQQSGTAGMAPMAPTDSSQPFGPGMPTAPTSNLPPDAAAGAGATGPAYGSAGTQIPMSPTPRSYAPSPSAYSSYGAMQSERQRMMASAHSGFSKATAGPEKVYSGYQINTTGVSPYMNLFRRDTAGGTVDNYTTLVRPALEQQMANQRFNMDIYGLERNARIQQSTLQQMERQNARTPQSIGTPQFYMNAGNYYPGYGSYGPYGP